jgi:hypothetical protein
MDEVYLIPSKTFPRNIREVLLAKWDPRWALKREMVKIESQRILRPGMDPEAGRPPERLDPDLGGNIDRKA